jgi:hypothetical protein
VYTLETSRGIKAIHIYNLIVVCTDGKKYITDNEPQWDTEISIKISKVQILDEHGMMLHYFRHATPVSFKPLWEEGIQTVRWFTFFFWLYSPLWTLASLTNLPQTFLPNVFFYHASTFNVFTSFKTLSSLLNLGLPFFREPSGWEKVIFLQDEFSFIPCRWANHLHRVLK